MNIRQREGDSSIVSGLPLERGGAGVIPEFDMGVSGEENGTVIPFELSTSEAAAPVRVGDGPDTSHGDVGILDVFEQDGPDV